MTKITNEYDRELKAFTDGMRYKLHVNRHKGKWENMSLPKLFAKLREEIDELESEIMTENQNQTAVLLEACDVGNVAMMIVNVAMKEASSVENQFKGVEACQDSSNVNTGTSPSFQGGQSFGLNANNSSQSIPTT